MPEKGNNNATVGVAVAVAVGSALISVTLMVCSNDVESNLKKIHDDLYTTKHHMESIDRELRGVGGIPSSIEKSIGRTVTVKVIPQPNPADKKAELERLLAKVKKSHDEIDAIINSPEFIEDRQKLILEERRKIKEAMDRLEAREKTE